MISKRKKIAIALLIVLVSIGIYIISRPAKAVISITTTPATGAIYINGQYVGTGFLSKEYPPGTYEITFGSISGYHTPKAQIVTLKAGDQINIVETYIPFTPAKLTFSSIVQTINGVSPSIYSFIINNNKPMFSITVSNSGETKAEYVRLLTRIEGLTEWQTQTVKDIDSNSSIFIGITPIIPETAVTGFTESTYREVSIKVEYTSGGKEMPPTSTSKQLIIYSKNALPLKEALEISKKYGIKSFESFLAYWVKSQDPSVRNIAASATAGKYTADEMAKAIFDELGRRDIRYANDPSDPLGGDVDYIQFPSETLSLKRGDCDDLSVLYSSCLEAVGIETQFAFTPNHVFVRYRSDADWHSVEATKIKAPASFLGIEYYSYFDEARNSGTHTYDQYLGTEDLTIVNIRDAWNLGIH